MEALNLEFLRIAIALIGTGAAAYQDYKTSFIDEKIIYLMLAAGLFLNILPFLLTGDLLIVYATLVSIIILLLGYVFYRKGQLGMGDVLLFVAIQQLLPLAPLSSRIIPPAFNIPDASAFADLGWYLVEYVNVFKHLLFFITIFLVSSFIATLGSSFGYARMLLLSGKALRPNRAHLALALIMLVLGTAFLFVSFGVNLLSGLFLLLFIASAFFLAFREQILEEIVVQKIPISKIEDEDILAIERMPQVLVKKYKLEKVLTQAQIKILKLIEKKEKMKLFPVNKILPRFGPYIFIALVIGLLLGNVMDMIIVLGGK